MANKYWVGGAVAVAQVSKVQITSNDIYTTYSIVIGGISVSVEGNVGGAGDTATALVQALNASTHTYFTRITWAVIDTDYIQGTADTAGCPFVFTTSVSGGSGSFGSVTNTTGNAGPNCWDVADNWSDNAVPVSSDNVIIDRGPNILWGLAQSAVVLASLEIRKTFTGLIGLNPEVFVISADGTSTSPTIINDYRDDYLHIKTSILKVGEHIGSGSPTGSRRIKINLDSTACTVTVMGTGSTSQDTGKPACRILTNSASTSVYVRQAPGGFGIATDKPFETSTIGNVYVTGEAGSKYVRIGSGVTITGFTQYAGDNTLSMAATITSVTIYGGNLTIEGGYKITTLTIDGGTIYANNVDGSGDTADTVNLNGGILDMTQSCVERDLTTVNAKVGSKLIVNHTIDIGTLVAEQKISYVF